jgi:hypothetical protein
MSILVTLAVRSDRPHSLARHDTRLDVSARIPAMWHTQTFDNDLGLATHTGFVVSNVPHRFDYPDLGGGRSTSAWDMSAVPPHAVVVELGSVVRLAGACNAELGNEPVTDFPLSLDDADMIKSGPRFGSPPRLYIPVCLVNGNHFSVNAWFFPEASARDRELADELISSIEPAV